jgi:hypothetical protein
MELLAVRVVPTRVATVFPILTRMCLRPDVRPKSRVVQRAGQATRPARPSRTPRHPGRYAPRRSPASSAWPHARPPPGSRREHRVDALAARVGWVDRRNILGQQQHDARVIRPDHRVPTNAVGKVSRHRLDPQGCGAEDLQQRATRRSPGTDPRLVGYWRSNPVRPARPVENRDCGGGDARGAIRRRLLRRLVF